MNIFLETFSNFIQPSDTVILAVSGGVDSMVLFDMVKKHHLREKIIVAHFDHSLRWVESDSDRELVANICKSENIICEVEKMDIRKIAKDEKNSLEAVARERRYGFFHTVREKYNARYILTAHHMDDQMETILLWLMKWWKIRGLSGMSPLSGYIFRPFLGIKKSEILEYAQTNQIIYHEDSTNSDRGYARNNIRHTLVPILRSIEPSIDTMFMSLGEYMQEASVYLESHIEKWLFESEKNSGKPYSFFSSTFTHESYFFQREIISYLYARAHNGSTQWLSRGGLDECIRFIREASNSHGVKEIKNLRLERRGERVYYL